jgi:hypothetical protein
MVEFHPLVEFHREDVLAPNPIFPHPLFLEVEEEGF